MNYVKNTLISNCKNYNEHLKELFDYKKKIIIIYNFANCELQLFIIFMNILRGLTVYEVRLLTFFCCIY